MIAWLTDTLIYTGALIALVLVLRRPVARHFGAQMCYALWALPLLRFAMPPVVLPASFAPRADVSQTAAIVAGNSAVMPAGVVAAPVYEPSFWQVWGGTVAAAAFSVWLAGALTFLAWRGWTYFRMREWLLGGARPVGEAGKVRLVESPAVSSPVAFGVSDKVVALPPGFMAAENRAARDLAIEHELAHHRGHDLLANILAQPILALHWFNPLAWLGWRAMRRDQEAACDARVIAAREPWERAAYGQVIASFASGQRLALAAPMACPVLGEKSIIHRLRSLGMDEISPRRRVIGRALLAGAALTLPVTASISYAEASAEPKASPAADAITIVDVPEGADRSDAALHTRVIARDGQTIILKTAHPVTDAEAEASIARAQASMARAEAFAARGEATKAQREALARMRQSMSDKQRAEYDAKWAERGDEWARQGDQAAKDAEKSADAWSKWGEQYGQRWADWGEQLGKRIAASVPAEPAPPAARMSAVEVPVPSYGCDRNGNLLKIGPNGRNPAAGDPLKWCGKVADANASARRALIQARSRIANDRTMDEDARDQVLDSLDDEIERLDDIAEANS
ncbi:MAG: M56 family metallopeptidase [Candidatus Andeanibacterium colombiense]|uniref:M56 family metallopeptidase n=1 Tax=Candidatus Andeanibacterium colombiense TaxID=3121345 RepID=A0AAJ5X7C9_9SPHN|nr:MAG: M56 family metallopeptidase [Sphingomonadaceae bacterium]